MTPNDWSRIRAVFDEALLRSGADRDVYLAGVGRDEPEVRAEVDALLAAHDAAEAAHAFESPFADATGDGSALRTGNGMDVDESGQRVGPYRLGRRLGRGGMGSVYLAERVDGQFRQTVALKVIRRGLDTDDVLARFALERQVLAGLDHPNIARIYDGGVTGDGRPYFAMEVVEGEPITDYCDRHRLSTTERLDLFRTVCRAVQHAHRNLVVHRDLKPSNILVADRRTGDERSDADDRRPQVKLLDFGIAKLLADDAGATHWGEAGLQAPRTRTGRRVLTPEYAAPEQVRGEAVTTATDVYQLGVLLYELLTGRRPYRLSSRMQREIERVILEEMPERPSTAVARTEETGSDRGPVTLTPQTVSRARSTDAGRLQRQLAGDLDVICLKALHKDPDRRYADVDALAGDLERHRSGRPVTARPDTFTYRASRFVRRHRIAVTAAVLVVAAVLSGAGLALWQSRVAATERDRAEAALTQAEGTLAFLEDVIASGGPGEGSPDTPIGVVLDSAAARVNAELADQPEVARAVHTSLSGVFFEMGRLEAAESSARAALGLFQAPNGADYGQAAQALAMALDYRDDHDGAQAAFEDAIRSYRAAPGADALLAGALNTYASVLLDVGDEDAAQAALEESLSLFRRLGDTDVLYPMTTLGVLHNYRGRFAQALPLFREVVAILRARHDGPHYETGEALGNLAATLSELGRRDEALAVRREAVEMLDATVGEAHHSALISRATFSNELRQAGEIDAAETEGRRAVDVALQAFGPSHSLTAYAQNVAGQALCAGSDPSAGAGMLRASLDTRRDVLPAGNWLIANGESLLGDCLARLGQTAEARRLLQSGYDGLRAVRGDDHLKTVEARQRMEAWE